MKNVLIGITICALLLFAMWLPAKVMGEGNPTFFEEVSLVSGTVTTLTTSDGKRFKYPVKTMCCTYVTGSGETSSIRVDFSPTNSFLWDTTSKYITLATTTPGTVSTSCTNTNMIKSMRTVVTSISSTYSTRTINCIGN